MNNLQLISRERPGNISIENFEELKKALSEQLAIYENIAYTPETIKIAKDDKKTLSKLRKAIEDKRKEIKRNYMQPYNVFEGQIKELVALIDTPFSIIKDFIAEEDARSKAEKRADIESFYRSVAAPLGNLAETVLNSSAFYDAKWENKTTSVKTYQDEIKEKINVVSRDIRAIQSSGGKNTTALLNKYLETMSMEEVFVYKKALEATGSANDVEYQQDEDDNIVGYKVLKISGTQSQFIQIMEQIELLGMEVYEIEDGMPQEMTELITPDFESFVAFDIETTGTFGAAAGDTPPEITEIGAVKVINGEIVERFSELANPGRKIVPRIARLTGITDEMLKDKPGIIEVIKKFKEFADDFVLVGHNIKNCDIPYITKAAKKAGIALENKYFDTYRYAKTIKETNGWDNVKLEYLSEKFGISQPDAHRAWCDAEANAGVYFKLKELRR